MVMVMMIYDGLDAVCNLQRPRKSVICIDLEADQHDKLRSPGYGDDG